MTDRGMTETALVEALLELANRADLEVRVLSGAGAGVEFRPNESAACRVGERIWVVLAPDDPAAHQARVLGEALCRFRAEFLEEVFVAPGVRDFLGEIAPKA